MKRIKKAVIAAAGRGTRFLPATKAMPKEMIPILEKPGIQYIVEEFVDSGITDIAIVTRGEKRDEIYKKHFGKVPELEEYLKENKKEEELKEIQAISKLANITFFKQLDFYGNGVPFLTAKDFVGNEPCVYAFGDDLVLSPNKPMTKALIEKYNETPGVICAGQEVPEEEVVRYGIVKLRDEKTMELDEIIEKPSIEEAPSNLVAFGRYILEPEIMEILAQRNVGKGNEVWLADAIEKYIREGGKAFISKVPEGGEWLTTGDPFRFLKASIEFGLKRDGLKDDLKAYLKSIK